jgi:arylsulfatase A-like enzyme
MAPGQPASPGSASRRRWAVVAIVLVLAGLPSVWTGTGGRAEAADTRPNIVFILTDDQRWDSLWAMPTVQRELVAKGMTFRNFFYTNPLCCPSRTSILTGRYSRNTSCWTNSLCFSLFRHQEPFTIAASLQRSGYRTALIGKYLNGYRWRDRFHVPSGWDRWVAATFPTTYFGARLAIDGHGKVLSRDDYLTDALARYADGFIRSSAERSGPLFLHFSPLAPHAPATPAPRHRNLFGGLSPYRPPSFNERNVADKPSWIRSRGRLGSERVRNLDEFRRLQYQSLRAVDDALGVILDSLADTGRTNTMIVFSSDNGLLWGEHRIAAQKSAPYEETIRGPLVIRWDGVVRRGSSNDDFVQNVDLAPTWAEVAGALLLGADGRSIAPLLRGRAPPDWRAFIMSEHGMVELVAPPWCLVRGPRFKYVVYPYDRQEELYDLRKDPFELVNVAGDPSYRAVRRDMQRLFLLQCTPPPPPPLLSTP